MSNNNRAEIENALIKSIDFSLLDQDRMVSFLNDGQTEKDSIIRVCTWLIQFKLVSDEKEEMIKNILDLYQDYIANVNLEFNDSNNNPFHNVHDEETSLIFLDVKRIADWFSNMAEPMQFDQCYLEDFQFHICRILYFLPRLGTKSDFHYIQGFDRYAAITYLLSLDFIRKISNNNLLPFSIEFAEMLSVHFTRHFIDLSRLLIDISNSTEKTMAVFENIDKIIEKEIPSISKNLKKCSTSSVHFALRWTLLLFADEHDFKNCLVLWDHFILHQNDFPEYIIKISIRHLKQVPYDGFSYIDKIQNFRNWNVPQIIKESESQFDESFIWMCGIGILMTGIGVFGGLKFLKRKLKPPPTLLDDINNIFLDCYC